MASSDPAWMSHPFGLGWEEVDRHIQRIENVWDNPAFAGGAVSEKTEDQLTLLSAALQRMVRHMQATWPSEAWAAFRRTLDPLPSRASLNEQIARIEYQLVNAWHAQQVQAYWSSLPEAERQRQQNQIQDYVNNLPPLSSES
jgi:hypothetical protein